MARTVVPTDWCCSLDADVPELLSKAEMSEYSRKSLQAAVAKRRGLVPCPQPDCPGIAAAGAKLQDTQTLTYYQYCILETFWETSEYMQAVISIEWLSALLLRGLLIDILHSQPPHAHYIKRVIKGTCSFCM